MSLRPSTPELGNETTKNENSRLWFFRGKTPVITGIAKNVGTTAVLIFALGMTLVALRQVNFFFSVPGDLRDARFNSVILEHLHRWVVGKAASLWDPRFFFPNRGTLAFSDNHFGTSAVYVLSRLLGMSRELSFQIWFLVAYVLNYWACFFALRRLDVGSNSRFSDAVGAFIFAFALPVIAQDGHAQLGYRYGVPLASLACWQFLSRSDLKYLSLAVLWVTIQFYCGIYIGYFLCLLLLSLTGVFLCAKIHSVGITATFSDFLIRPIRNASSRQRRSAGLIIAGSCAALTALLLPYYTVAKTYGFRRSPKQIALMLPRPVSYLLADRSLLMRWVDHRITNIPLRWEHQMFIGVAPLIFVLLGGVSVVRGHLRNCSRFFAWAWIALIALTLSVSGISLYSLLCRLPGINSIRAITRIILVMLFPVAVLARSGCVALMGDRNSRHRNSRTVLTSILFLALVVEAAAFQPLSVPVKIWRSRIRELKQQLPSPLPRNSILYVGPKPGEHTDYGELDGMILAQDEGVATVNGYSGNMPGGFVGPEGCGTALQRLSMGSIREHIRRNDFCTMVHHLVLVRSSICHVEPSSAPCPVPYAGPLPDKVMQGAQVRIVDIRERQDGWWADVQIRNNSDSTIPSLSTTGNPIRLSWTFRNSNVQNGFGRWDTRWLLDGDVSAHGEIAEAVQIFPPTRPGSYVLGMSMVQEGVAWFQDRGMHVANSKRAVLVDEDGQAFLEDGPLPDSVFRSVQLHITRVKYRTPRSLSIMVSVKNNSGFALEPLSQTKNPLRLSWRFVPLEKSSSATGWDTRLDLAEPIPAHGASTQVIQAGLPSAPGRYELQVSMVQEGVAWFQDKGMSIAQSSEPIVIDERGRPESH